MRSSIRHLTVNEKYVSPISQIQTRINTNYNSEVNININENTTVDDNDNNLYQSRRHTVTRSMNVSQLAEITQQGKNFKPMTSSFIMEKDSLGNIPIV
jgi:hypothetical protein